MRISSVNTLFLLLLSAATHAQFIEQRAGFPAEGRDDGVVTEVGGTLYAGSGLTGGFYVVNDWWAYSFERDAWTQLPDMPLAPRQYIRSFTYRHFIYLFGGYQSEQNTFNDLWRFDTKTGMWQEMAPLPGHARWGSFAFAFGAYAYVGGGKDTLHYLSDFYRYSFPEDRWERLPDLPFGPRGHGISAGNGVYAIIGLGANDTSDTHQDLWKFNGVNEQFTRLADFTYPLWRAGAALIALPTGYKLYVWGGEQADKSYSGFLHEVDVETGVSDATALTNAFSRRGTSMLPYRDGAAVLFGVDEQNARLTDFYYVYPEDLTIDSRSIEVYPNPAKENKIAIESNVPLSNIQLFSLAGTRVYETFPERGQRSTLITLPNLKQGTYVLRWTDVKGGGGVKKLLIL